MHGSLPFFFHIKELFLGVCIIKLENGYNDILYFGNKNIPKNRRKKIMENDVIEIEKKKLEEIIKESVKQAMEKAFEQMTQIMETAEEKALVPESEEESVIEERKEEKSPLSEREESVQETITRKLQDKSFKVPNIRGIDPGDLFMLDENEGRLFVALEKVDGKDVIEVSAYQENSSDRGVLLSLEQAEDMLDYMRDACRTLAKYYIAKNPKNPFEYAYAIRNVKGYCIGVRRIELPDDISISLHVRDKNGQFLGYIDLFRDQYEKIYNIMTQNHYKKYSLKDGKYKITFISKGKTKMLTFKEDCVEILFPITDEMVKELLEVLK